MNRRQFLGLSGASIALPAVAFGEDTGAPAACVGDITIAGASRFPTITDAIMAAPKDGVRPYRIIIGPGVWRERLIVDRPHIHLEGIDRASTIIVFGLAAGMAGDDGKALGTWNCASVMVRAPGFHASNLTIENSFDYLGHLVHPRFEHIGSNGAQAVALMLATGSDHVHLRRVTLIGHQDTLFVDGGRALFEDCAIFGSVDFIFGAATAWFETCHIISRFRPGLQRNHGYIAAPSTLAVNPYGLVFNGCRLGREPEVPDGSVVLGRPWRPTRQFADGAYGDPAVLGSALYLRCWMDAHISADGWDEMGYTDKGGARVFLKPDAARFGEYGSAGPGSFQNPRRRQLDRIQAASLSPQLVLR